MFSFYKPKRVGMVLVRTIHIKKIKNIPKKVCRRSYGRLWLNPETLILSCFCLWMMTWSFPLLVGFLKKGAFPPWSTFQVFWRLRKYVDSADIWVRSKKNCISSSIDPKSVCSLSWIAMILPMRVVHAFAVVFWRCSYCNCSSFSIRFLSRDFIRWTIITWLYREYTRQSIDLYFEQPQSHRHPSFCCFNICEGYNSCVLFKKNSPWTHTIHV